MKAWTGALAISLLFGCASVNEGDLASWSGKPVHMLDAHPVFNTMPVEVRRLSDGTEVRNYVNGMAVESCFGNARGSSFSPMTVFVSSSSFCSSQFAACNNQFYIKNGYVTRYIPVGSGGARCFTDARTRPMQM